MLHIPAREQHLAPAHELTTPRKAVIASRRENGGMQPHELRDLDALAAYDFEGRNEAEIRGDWIEPLLRLLGYGLGTRHQVVREQVLRLQPPVRMVGSSRLEIDFVPTVFGHRLWIIEAKRPQGDLFDDEHLGQAWSYATDPRVDVPLMVLCDGARLAVFDVTRVDWNSPLFDRPKAELAEQFDELFAFLGAPRVAEKVRRLQLAHLRQALEAQIDLKALDKTITEVQSIVEEVRPKVHERRQEIRREARERLHSAGNAAIDSAGMWGHAQAVNGPHFFRWADVDRAVELVLRQPVQNRQHEFDDIEHGTTPKNEEHSRMWFPLRILRMLCAALLIEDPGCGDYCRQVALDAARSHVTGFAGDSLLAEVYRLQRMLGPLGWRLAAASKSVLDEQAALLEARLDVEEWLRLDGEIGITATDNYLRAARLWPVVIQSSIRPWDAETVRQAADAVEELLGRLPTPKGFEHLQPATDPWMNSWLIGDPLRTDSEFVLRELPERVGAPSLREFAVRLWEISKESNEPR